MPKVYLTEAQRQEAKLDRQSKMLGDGLTCYKALNRLTLEQIGTGLGMSKNTVLQIMNEKDVRIPIRTMWKLLDLVGLEVRRKEPGQREASA